MATQGSKNSAAESEADKTKTLNTNSMEILVAAFSKAIKIEMTAGVAATSAAVTVAINAQYSRAKTTKYTSAIGPYNNQSFFVVDHRGKERDIEELTLAKVGNNVRAYLTKIQEKHNKIGALRKDSFKFDDQRWLTVTFEQLVKTGYFDFLEDVKRQRSKLIKDISTFD